MRGKKCSFIQLHMYMNVYMDVQCLLGDTVSANAIKSGHLLAVSCSQLVAVSRRDDTPDWGTWPLVSKFIKVLGNLRKH